jgi:hypothetical protein
MSGETDLFSSGDHILRAHFAVPLILPMSSTFRNIQNIRGEAISSDFDRRVLVVGGFRESRLSPDDNRKGCDRHWMSSSIQVMSEAFFLESESLSWSAFETDSRLSQLEAEAFCKSGLTSIHLPASVTVIGKRCFSGCGSLASITFESASQLSQLPKEAFSWSVLTSIHLPASVSVIGESCFSDCDSLASITFDPASTFRGHARDLLAGLPLF